MNETFEIINAINIKDTNDDYAYAFKIDENSLPIIVIQNGPPIGAMKNR